MGTQDITRGSDFKLSFRLTKGGAPEPLGLGGGDEITVRLPAASGNSVEFTLTSGKVVVDSDARGEFSLVGDEVDSASIKEAAQQSYTVIIKRGTEDIVLNVKNSLNVESPALQAP